MTLRMLARVAGQSFHLHTGNSYYADEHRVIHDVDPNDAGELRRVGCVELPADEPATVVVASEPEPEPAAEAEATKLFGYTNLVPDAETEPKVKLDPAIGHHEAPEESAE